MFRQRFLQQGIKYFLKYECVNVIAVRGMCHDVYIHEGVGGKCACVCDACGYVTGTSLAYNMMLILS